MLSKNRGNLKPTQNEGLKDSGKSHSFSLLPLSDHYVFKVIVNILKSQHYGIQLCLYLKKTLWMYS